jgi:hypothetical protein
MVVLNLSTEQGIHVYLGVSVYKHFAIPNNFQLSSRGKRVSYFSAQRASRALNKIKMK